MAAYIVRRIGYMVGVLLIVSFLVFFVMDLVPGDIAQVSLGTRATTEMIAQRRAAWGLDRPLMVRYLDWLGSALRGDLGESFYAQRPVTEIISEKLPVTLGVSTFGLVVAMAVGIPLGTLAAARHGTWVDRLSIGLATLGVSIPGFWLGLNLILLFAVYLDWFPVGGYVPPREGLVDWLRHLVLPGASIGLINAAVLARMTRGSLLDVLGELYILVARAKGLLERVVILGHGIRNAIMPVVTSIGMMYATLMGHTVVIETIFTIPGISQSLLIAVNKRDVILLQGLMLLIAWFFVVLNLLVDVAYAYLNPRIRYD